MKDAKKGNMHDCCYCVFKNIYIVHCHALKHFETSAGRHPFLSLGLVGVSVGVVNTHKGSVQLFSDGTYDTRSEALWSACDILDEDVKHKLLKGSNTRKNILTDRIKPIPESVSVLNRFNAFLF